MQKCPGALITLEIYKTKIKSICVEHTLEEKCLKLVLICICARAVLQIIRKVIPGVRASKAKPPLSKLSSSTTFDIVGSVGQANCSVLCSIIFGLKVV